MRLSLFKCCKIHTKNHKFMFSIYLINKLTMSIVVMKINKPLYEDISNYTDSKTGI